LAVNEEDFEALQFWKGNDRQQLRGGPRIRQ